MRIGIDIMGGDFAPTVNVLGSIRAQKELPENTQVVLIGDEAKIEPILAEHAVSSVDFEVIHTSEVIEMGEHPTRAISQKTDSSIFKGFELLKKAELDTFASTGNTGAMLVGSMYSVNAVEGVMRPCITSILPKLDGGVNILLDVGTNVDCKPEMLNQFGVLGSIFAEHVYHIKEPKIGLLNVGEEKEKGNLLTQTAYGLLAENKHLNFVGNVEGRDLFGDKVDVIVCDGFTGNVILKQAEAMYALLKKRGVQDEYFERFNYENYGGTPILGINSNVLIGHGISNEKAIKNMLLLAHDVAQANLPVKIKQAFSND